MALTARQVETSQKPGYRIDSDGLYLRIMGSGAKSWSYCYRLNKRDREMTLGSIKDLSLAQARVERDKQRALVRQGIDAIEHRRAQRHAQRAVVTAAVPTFDECAEAYIEAHEVGWKNEKHAAQWRSTLKTYCSPAFGTVAVHQVDTVLVLKALKPIWTIKPETATRVRGRVERILNWAKARGYRQGENPAAWRGHLDNFLAAMSKKRRARHHPALPFEEVSAFRSALREQDGIAARALEFTMLTAARTGEVISARWSEIDLEVGVWTIPAERMKAGTEHRVPLSPQVICLLRGLPAIQGEDFVFPGQRKGKHLSNMAMLGLLQDKDRMNRPDITVHGFRSTFRDWAAERTNFSRDVCEMALAHVVSDQVEAAYRRGDLFAKRRKLMETWANFCDTVKVASVARLDQQEQRSVAMA